MINPKHKEMKKNDKYEEQGDDLCGINSSIDSLPLRVEEKILTTGRIRRRSGRGMRFAGEE